MHTPETVIALLASYGYVLLLPLAILEGPIVSTIAGFLVAQGAFGLLPVYVILVLGDLIGDALHYAAGRWGGTAFARWFPKVRGTKLRAAAAYLRKKPGRALVFGKLTHSAGFVFLVAAGAARVPFGIFILYNLLATLPKTLLFLALGYFLGSRYAAINSWIGKGSIALFVLVTLFLLWFFRERIAALGEPPEAE